MNEELVEALAEALDVPLPPERLVAVTAQVQGQLAGRGGSSAEEVEGVEPAIVFDPGWDT
jgi:hypothetical protein